ncbi:putative transcriptional regulator [Mycobacteroides abscessus subsp. abscessus]|uniref:ParB/RepB/Spo0J family partition protein n=1 Tax=Mycobacteroides abscessus TaxID=36809 RepID=UPI00092B3E90|nr:ParB/RepB/Spo0J family partition protein [Mycobacteroides abscessus]SIJ22216.1 putative transcriptional regulator [Mycobacteroides abscessus subsp. abscessus]SLH38495.1 putative transcriptional regulator [Mycobacteroides abscessus subsp. abscessus]
MARGGVKPGFEFLPVGKDSPVDGDDVVVPVSGARSAPLRELVGNPKNPRDDIGDLEDLASIAERQLQPVVVVTRAAYEKLYPEVQISARWVVVIGNRRLAAAHKYGRPELDIVVRDDLAIDHGTLLSSIISENVDRDDFDVIEEAKAVQQLVDKVGSADEAAKLLHKSKGWISQRRSLLGLAPELQASVRRRELAVREARSLARLPKEEQIARWRAAVEGEQPARGSGEDGSGQTPPTDHVNGAPTRTVTKALKKFDDEPSALAIALRDQLGDTGAKTLVSQLRKLLK